jgi:hypothetical protein
MFGPQRVADRIAQPDVQLSLFAAAAAAAIVTPGVSIGAVHTVELPITARQSIDRQLSKVVFARSAARH